MHADRTRQHLTVRNPMTVEHVRRRYRQCHCSNEPLLFPAHDYLVRASEGRAEMLRSLEAATAKRRSTGRSERFGHVNPIHRLDMFCGM